MHGENPRPDREVRFRDRKTGALQVEKVYGGDALRFLYEDRHGRLLTRLVLRRRALNHVYGWFQRRSGSRRRIQNFVDRLGIDVAEAEHPLAYYRSLDDFFTRRLRPGARPVDPDPKHLVSPADGRTLVFPRLEPADALRVKGSRVRLEELLEDARLGRRFSGGGAVVVRLAPADYHRFHFPDSGTAGPPRPIDGLLDSVHPIALAAGATSFINSRVVTLLESRGFGLLALIEVGALLVGTMVQTYRPGPVERGQEKGYFCFGGSTVVLLAEPGRLAIDDDLVRASAEGVESYTRMGERIGRAPEAAP